MLAVQLLLVAMLLAAGFSLLYPSPGLAVLLAGLSAAWLPTNNGHLEGPMLLSVSSDHGLTTADLLAYLGLALALLAAWRWRRDRMQTHGACGPGVRPAGDGRVRRGRGAPVRLRPGRELARPPSAQRRIIGFRGLPARR